MLNGVLPDGAAPADAANAGSAVVESDPLHLRAAVAVSELTRALDGSLEALAARRARNGLGPTELARARELLRLVGAALVGSASAARWHRIEAACLAAERVPLVEEIEARALQALAPMEVAPPTVQPLREDVGTIPGDAGLEATASDRSPTAGSALPFSTRTPSDPPAYTQEPRERRVSAPVSAFPVTPFGPSLGKPPNTADPPPRVGPSMGRREEPRATQRTGEMMAFEVEVLPFQGGGLTSPPSERPQNLDASRTVLPFLTPNATAAQERSTASDRGPLLTIEQFASFVAEREAYPAAVESIRTRYGIPSLETERHLDARFRADFARDPAAARAFEEARARYRDWLLGR